jgi:hypothetical protein
MSLRCLRHGNTHRERLDANHSALQHGCRKRDRLHGVGVHHGPGARELPVDGQCIGVSEEECGRLSTARSFRSTTTMSSDAILE